MGQKVFEGSEDQTNGGVLGRLTYDDQKYHDL